MSVFKKHVLVCGQQKPQGIPSCGGAGGLAIFEDLRVKIFQAKKENEIMVTATGCLGTCGVGPVLVVYPEGVWYTGVKKEDLDRIVNEHLIGDKPLEDRENATDEQMKGELQSWNMRNRMMLSQAGKL